MTGLEAWAIISSNMSELYRYRNAASKKPYSQKEVEAEVVCFEALKKLDKESK